MSDDQVKPLYLFLDTNTFIHFRFGEIDWPTLTGQSEIVIVAALRTVIRELDQHKNVGKSQRLRDRARTVVKWISERSDPKNAPAVVRNGVTFQVVNESPPRIEGLDQDHADDRLVATALHFRDAGQRLVRLVTDDTALTITARAHGLDPIDPPETHRLPGELDDLERELKTLRVENEKLKNQRPRLGLQFANGERDLLVARPNLKTLLTDGQLAVKLDLYRETVAMRGWVPDLDAAVKQHEGYLHQQKAFLERDVVTFSVDLLLINDGTAPAQNADVTIEIPDRMIVLVERETPPVEPRASAANAMREIVPQIAFRREFAAEEPPWFKLDGGERWRHHVGPRLMQAEKRPIPPLFLRPRDQFDRKGFPIKVCVRAASPPILEDIELNVRFEP